jgi:hypothetical protein
MVIRAIGILVGVALIGYPPFLIYAMSVPVPRFRTGTYVDFLTFAGALVAIYGGVLLGIAVHWGRSGRPWRRLRPLDMFKAGFWGTLTFAVAFLVSAGLRGMSAQGSFEKGIGNLWGLILILAAIFGALVSGGVALLVHGLRPPRGTSRS